MATIAEEKPVVWPRDGYLAEWLALEDFSGGRYQMTGNFDADIPTYNAIFAGMSKQWPQFEDDLEVREESTDETCQNTKVRIYQPKNANAASLPLIVFFHGGGLICGNLDTEDAQCRYLAVKTPCVVISVDYPKVINSKLTMDNVIADYAVPAVLWSQKRASALGADPSKIVLCGGSAGAMICTQTAYHYAIEKGDQETIAGLLLWYGCYFPYTYDEGSGKYKEMYKSWKEHGRGQVPVLHEKLAEAVWSHWNADFDSPRHFPGLADKLPGWPTTYLVSAEKDLLRDDTLMFEQVLKESDVPYRHDHYTGLPHWFHTFPMLTSAQTMMAKSVEAIKYVLTKPDKA